MNHNLKDNLIFAGAMVTVFGAFISYGIYHNNNAPACPAYDTKEVGTKLISHDMGSVNIEGEDCHIIEVSQHICYTGHYHECKGDYLFCSDRTISRITKCPSGTVTNSVTQTGGKFSHEEVQ